MGSKICLGGLSQHSEHLKMRRVVTHNKVARYGAEHLEYVKTTEKCAHQTSCWMLAKSVNKILR